MKTFTCKEVNKSICGEFISMECYLVACLDGSTESLYLQGVHKHGMPFGCLYKW